VLTIDDVLDGLVNEERQRMKDENLEQRPTAAQWIRDGIAIERNQ
jgi:hypothetical protein